MTKKIIFLVLLIFTFYTASFAIDIPSPVGFVNDFAGVLTDSEKKEIETFLDTFSKETSNEIAIAIINTLDNQPIESYSIKMAREWGIGQEDKNNGVLLLVAINDRQMRIEVGRGLEGAITDLESRYILDEITRPYFREENYYTGIFESVRKLTEMAQGEFDVPTSYTSKTNFSGKSIRFFIILFFVVISWLGAVLGRSKKWWPGGIIGAVTGGGISWIFGSVLFSIIGFAVALGIIGLAFDYIVSNNYQKVSKSGGRMPWWIGGGIGRSGGRSFGSFSGGSFSGGGSSSSW